MLFCIWRENIKVKKSLVNDKNLDIQDLMLKPLSKTD